MTPRLQGQNCKQFITPLSHNSYKRLEQKENQTKCRKKDKKASESCQNHFNISNVGYWSLKQSHDAIQHDIDPVSSSISKWPISQLIITITKFSNLIAYQTVLISALIGQCSRTVSVMPVIGQYAPPRARLNGFFSLNFLCFN